MATESDATEITRISEGHVIVETGGCADANKVYSMYTTWGIRDPDTGDITDPITSTGHSHQFDIENQAVADTATYTCTTKTLDAGEEVVFM